MIFYLNKGLILEQAIAVEIENYLNSIHFEESYPNFHVHVTNNHPFAHLYLHTTLTAADSFPSIVVTTETTRKPGDLHQLPQQVNAVSISRDDIEEFEKAHESLEGICTFIDPVSKENLLRILEKKDTLKGICLDQYKTDRVSIEIWADNVQVKNEIYEQLRLYLTGYFSNLMEEKYKMFGISMMDGTFSGERSNNYNVDFDVALSGGHISFEVNYCVSQFVIDTEAQAEYKDLIVEVTNHVKKTKYYSGE